jgi:hypothetical protein
LFENSQNKQPCGAQLYHSRRLAINSIMRSKAMPRSLRPGSQGRSRTIKSTNGVHKRSTFGYKLLTETRFSLLIMMEWFFGRASKSSEHMAF